MLGKLISGVLFRLGYIWAAFDDKKQTWHDKIAKIYAVETRPITQEQFLELQKDMRSNLPTAFIVGGIAEAIFPISIIFMILPKLARLYAEIGDKSYNRL